MNDTRNQNGITEGPIVPQILLFFFPILLGSFFQQLYNTVDAVIVGRFVGSEALAAVGGTTGMIVALFVNAFVGLSSGFGVVISYNFGARDERSVSTCVHTALVFSVICGVIISIVGFIFIRPVLELMHLPEELFPLSLSYLHIIFFGMTASLLYNMGSAILRAVGDSKRPFYYLVAACLTNIVLDILFVAVMGLATVGVALATVLSQIVSAVLVLRALLVSTESYRLYPERLRLSLPHLGRMVSVGLPAGIQSTMYNIPNVMIQAAINTFGTASIAAIAAENKLEAVYWMISAAFGVSVTTFVGQNLGAGKTDRIYKCIRTVFVMLGLSTILSSLLYYRFGRTMLLLFSSEEEVLNIGQSVLRYITMGYILFVPVEILSSTMRGIGQSFMSMLITLFGVCVIRVLWLIFYVPSHHTMFSILFSYPLTWACTAIAFIIYYFFFSPLSLKHRKENAS